MVARPEALLLCRVRSRLCALPIQHVAETMRPLPIEPLSGAPSFVLGIALIRGAPVPVIDPGVLLACAEDPLPCRLLLLRTGARQVALAVENVVGVRSVARTALAELPPLLRDAGAELVAGLGALDSELLLVLQATRALPEGIWESLAEGRA